MNDIGVGILGLLTITAVVVMLYRKWTEPAIAFIACPFILGLILVLGGRITFVNLADMIRAGLDTTGPTAVMFVFSILYFGIMTDVGMFDEIIACDASCF